MQNKVIQLAKEFEREYDLDYRLYCRRAYLFKIPIDIYDEDDDQIIINKNEMAILELLIQGGTFKKFNSNSGWTRNESIPDAFSHWSWDKYGYLVCDIQGKVHDGNRFVIPH